MFWIRYKATSGGAYTTITLIPGPTEVDYPDLRDYTAQTTADGAVVVSRPLKDGRPRKWIWRKYGPHIATYENQWQVLKQLEYRYRLEQNLWPLVEIWEDIVPEGGFLRGTAEAKVWTPVKFLRVQRTPKKGGGNITYDESTVEFVIEDATFTSF